MDSSGSGAYLCSGLYPLDPLYISRRYESVWAIPIRAGIFGTVSESSQQDCFRTPILIHFRKLGHPWVAWEWGADALMGAVYRLSGLSGIAMLYGVSVAAAVWMWFRLNRAVGGNSHIFPVCSSPWRR